MKVYKESKLENGIAILTSEDLDSEVVSISVYILAGSRYERTSEFGFAHFLEHMLMKGTKKRPSIHELHVLLDRAGAYSNANTSEERIQFIIEVVRERFDDMFEIISDMILNSILDKTVLENEKKIILQEYDRAYDNPSRRVCIESENRIFKGHPLGHTPLGTKECINSATPETLKEFYKRTFLPQRMAVVVSGGVTHDAVVSNTQKYFGSMKRGSEEGLDNRTTLSFQNGAAFEHVHSKQTQLVVSFPSSTISIEEEAIMRLYLCFLRSGRTSLLPEELRHKRGLVYGVDGYRAANLDAWMVFFQTQSTKPEEVIPIIVDRVTNASKYFTKELFEAYKTQYINLDKRFKSRDASDGDFLSFFWINYGKMVKPDDIYEIVRNAKYEDALEIIGRLITPKNLFIMAAGEKEFPISI